MSHTPGPWILRYLNNMAAETEGVSIEAGESEEIAFVNPGDSPNWDDNARLIAAAPELLEALGLAIGEALVRHNDSVRAAAIHNNSDGVGQRFDYVSPEPLPAWAQVAQAAIDKAAGGES